MKGKRDAWMTASVVFLLFVAIMVLEHFLLFSKYVVLSKSTSLYFFSALFQGNAALFAILGVFVVFRLQIERSSIGSIEQILLKDLNNFFGGKPTFGCAFEEFYKFKMACLEDKRSIAEKYAKECEDHRASEKDPNALPIVAQRLQSYLQLPSLLNAWVASEQLMKEIKTQIKLPIYVLATFMALSLVGLIFAAPIHHSHGTVELSILIAMAGGNICILYYLANCICRFLKDSDEKERESKSKGP